MLRPAPVKNPTNVMHLHNRDPVNLDKPAHGPFVGRWVFRLGGGSLINVDRYALPLSINGCPGSVIIHDDNGGSEPAGGGDCCGIFTLHIQAVVLFSLICSPNDGRSQYDGDKPA